MKKRELFPFTLQKQEENQVGSYNNPALILAAGRSTRMGFPKIMLASAGKPVLTQMVESLLQTGWNRVGIIISDLSLTDFLKSNAISSEILYNEQPDRGMISSIRIGLDWAGTESLGLLTWPVDHPLVTQDTLRLLKRYSTSANICRPTFEGKNGHPTWWGKSCWDNLLSPLADNGAKPVLYINRQEVLNINANDPNVLLNINTPKHANEHGLSRFIK